MIELSEDIFSSLSRGMRKPPGWPRFRPLSSAQPQRPVPIPHMSRLVINQGAKGVKGIFSPRDAITWARENNAKLAAGVMIVGGRATPHVWAIKDRNVYDPWGGPNSSNAYVGFYLRDTFVKGKFTQADLMALANGIVGV